MTGCSLYLISPPHFDTGKFLPALDEAFAAGGVKAFQLRIKDADDKEIIMAAEQILPICHKYDVAFIINDRPDLVRGCNADGVHLGQEDMSVVEARKIIGPNGVIGV